MYYAIPSLCAILIKIAILWKQPFSPSHKQKYEFLANPLFLFLFLSLFGLNLCELTLFAIKPSSSAAILLVKGYHVFYSLTLFTILAVALRAIDKLSSIWPLLSIAVGLSVLVVHPTLGIVGIEDIGYSVTRSPGPFYSVYMAGMFTTVLIALAVFLWGAFKHPDPHLKSRCKILLICFGPFTISSITIAVLMTYGFKVNATIITSFMISFLLLGLIYSESKYYAPQILSSLPGTGYFRSTETLTEALFDPNIPLEEAKEIMVLEKTRRALQLTKGNQTEAAKMLGVSRPTICRRIKALENYKGLPARPKGAKQVQEVS